MDDKRTPMEAEVQELPQKREPVCPEDFYGTAAKPRPRRSYAWFWICMGLVVIAVCTFSVVAAILHVRLENGESGWRLSMQTPPETLAPEETVNNLDAAGGEDYIPSRSGGLSAVRLPRSEAAQESLSPGEIYAQAAPAVVCVQVDSYYGSSLSTGVIVSADGYILSATEGLSGATAITVSFQDGTSLSASRVGEERSSGVCLLKAEAEALPTVSFASGQTPQVGDRIYCICNPYGSQIPNLFYEGMLSACQSLELNGTEFTVLQSSAQLQGVGYGCPILDSRGRVLGLTTPLGQRLVSGEDPCFAVSCGDLEQIVAAFEDTAAGDSPWLGLEVADIPEEYRMFFSFPGSVWIDKVAAGSAPDGVLYPNDVITSIDGYEVGSAEEFEQILSNYQAGDRVLLIIYRNGKWYRVQLPVTER